MFSYWSKYLIVINSVLKIVFVSYLDKIHGARTFDSQTFSIIRHHIRPVPVGLCSNVRYLVLQNYFGTVQLLIIIKRFE